jgi:uncharacterized protein YndB with AHSA1/START domain
MLVRAMTLEPITFAYQLACSPSRAFITYVDRIGEWWPATHTRDASTLVTVQIEPRVGGRVYASHLDGEDVWGEVSAYEPGVRLRYTFGLAQPVDEAPSEITVTFARFLDGCAVEFAHGGWHPGNAPFRAKFGEWRLLLDRYAALAAA